MFDFNLFAFMSFLVKILQIFVNPILALIYIRDKGRVTKPNNKILTSTIAELRSKIQSQEVKCVDVVQTYITRAKEVNPQINAIAEDRSDDAIREAQAIDLMCVNGGGEELGKIMPLLGIPFCFKQVLNIKGMSKHLGSLCGDTGKMDEDSEAMRLLKEAGAICIMTGNTPEKSIGWEAYNFVIGRTRNPHDFSKTCGGSSGGDCALLGADAAVFGVGTDFAGSIRLPGHFCGVLGHKPSPGLISIEGINPRFHFPGYEQISVVGPLARTADDLKLLVKVLAGKNQENLNHEPNIQQIKVFYMLELESRWFLSRTDNCIKEKIKEISKYFETKQVKVEQFDTKEYYYLPEITTMGVIFVCEFPHFLTKQKTKSNNNAMEKTEDDHASLTLEFLKSLFGCSKYTFGLLWFQMLCQMKCFFLPWTAKKWLAEMERVKTLYINQMSNDSVLLLPTYPTTAVTHNSTILRSMDATYITIANAFHLPCTQVPVGKDKNGMPFGIQVLAGPNNDALCLAVAKEIETYVKSCGN